MLDRMQAGEVPIKHHVQLRGPDGSLRYEHCITRRGFDGPYTIVYHERRPHLHVPVERRHGWKPAVPVEGLALCKRHVRTPQVPTRPGPQVDGRVVLCFNEDVTVTLVRPTEPDPIYFLNGDGDDLFFVHEGSGIVRSVLGDLRYERHDSVVIPKGVLWRAIPDAGVAQYWLGIECAGGVGLPSRWRTETGQLRMDAPYGHRDFRRPVFRGPLDEGIREVLVKRGGGFHAYRLPHSPLDAVGWDGSVYPWAFPILRFQPRVGLVHLPPDWHGTFATPGALICSFVPRLVDFHPDAIPCPYPHSSVDCDEILFYVSGNFTSRRGVGPASISYHPAGLPHGPHPGAYEASIGTARTDELAVMMDTLRPLRWTAEALAAEDTGYMASFLDAVDGVPASR
ncbi:MAG: homogentisate 1,2-dioxygenase [Myxococcota bacterium]|nr:homogentisate 1,2-dioxygenase [Myxococcota bacterium]